MPRQVSSPRTRPDLRTLPFASPDDRNENTRGYSLLPPRNPDCASSNASNAMRRIEAMERGTSPNRIRNKPLTKPPPPPAFSSLFTPSGVPVGWSVQGDHTARSGSMRPGGRGSGGRVPESQIPEVPFAGPVIHGSAFQTPKSQKPADYHSISGKSSSGNSQMSYPNSDEWKDPNSHRLNFPASLSAPDVSKETKVQSIQDEIHGILQ